MGDRNRGLDTNKFSRIEREDGQHRLGEKHEHCQYFILDLNLEHDPFAEKALLAYADACQFEYPLLAQDLRIIVSRQ